MGYIPNLSYGRNKKTATSPIEFLQDEHNCLRQILKQFIEIHNEGGIITEVMGKQRTVLPFIHLMNGDASGQQALVACYNKHFGTKCPMRKCLCGASDLGNPEAQCILRTPELVQEARESQAGLASISMHDIQNAFEGVPLGDQVYRQFGVVPSEVLHMLESGIYKYENRAVVQILGAKESNASEKNNLDILHRNLCILSTRQSERDMPRNTSKNGFGDSTKCTANENTGNLHIFIVSLFTSAGKKMYQKWLRTKNIAMRDFQSTLILTLCYKNWLCQVNPKHVVDSAQHAVNTMYNNLKKNVPRDEGQGWNLSKGHSAIHAPEEIKKFGCGLNMTGATGERCLKTIVKDLANMTQKRPSVFTDQICIQSYEQFVFNHAHKHAVVPSLGLDHVEISTSSSQSLSRGMYTITFDPMDWRGNGQWGVTWKNTQRERLKIGVADLMTVAIATFCNDHNWREMFQVTGYTSHKMKLEGHDAPVIFHANEFTHGAKWYDWAMVKFYQQNRLEEESTCPCQVLGFFKYSTPGTPTPHLVNNLRYSPGDVYTQRLTDDTLYAVVHSADDYLLWDYFKESFICDFYLGSVEKCLYIVPVEAISDPLWVVPDIGGDKKTRHWCCLPERMWGDYFSGYISEHNAKLDDDISSEEATVDGNGEDTYDPTGQLV